jgi:hypothetical protein
MFLSYSHEDEDLKKLFVKHMAPLRRANLALIWHDRDIRASEDWKNQIDTHLTSAKIILLLVSASFIESDYCYCNEMRIALERHKRGEAKVVPIIVRPAAWENTPLHALQAIPRNAQPVEMWSNKDEAWLNVVQEIKKLILPQK